MPAATPVLEFIVAIAGLVLDHVPIGTVLLYEAVLPLHIVAEPVIIPADTALMVNTTVVKQPLGNV